MHRVVDQLVLRLLAFLQIVGLVEEQVGRRNHVRDLFELDRRKGELLLTFVAETADFVVFVVREEQDYFRVCEFLRKLQKIGLFFDFRVHKGAVFGR